MRLTLSDGNRIMESSGDQIAVSAHESNAPGVFCRLTPTENAQRLAEIVHRVNTWDDLVSSLERLARVASVELGASRPDVLEQARVALSSALRIPR